MQTVVIRRISLLLLFFLYSAENTSASPVRDFYIHQALGRYFSLPLDARALSLSGIITTTCDGPQCIFLNPSGSAQVRRVSIAGNAGTGRIDGEEFLEQEDITRAQHEGFISLGIPLGSSDNGPPHYGNLMLGYSRYRGSTDDSINSTPDGHRRSLGYSLAVTESLSLGYSFHFYDDQLKSDLADLHSHARFLHHFGSQFQIGESTSLGAIIQYGLGQSDTEDFSTNANGLSRPRQYSIAVGLSHEIGGAKIHLTQDYNKVHSDGNLSEISSPAVVIGSDESGYFLTTRIGVESPEISGLTLRAGARLQYSEYTFDRSDLTSLTGNYLAPGLGGGVGYRLTESTSSLDAIRLSYGFEYSWIGDGSWQHTLSLVLPF